MWQAGEARNRLPDRQDQWTWDKKACIGASAKRSSGRPAIGPDGRLHLDVPLPPGTPVEVIVFVPAADDFSDLVTAAGSAAGFWDNPEDDEDWNAPDPR